MTYPINRGILTEESDENNLFKTAWAHPGNPPPYDPLIIPIKEHSRSFTSLCSEFPSRLITSPSGSLHPLAVLCDSFWHATDTLSTLRSSDTLRDRQDKSIDSIKSAGAELLAGLASIAAIRDRSRPGDPSRPPPLFRLFLARIPLTPHGYSHYDAIWEIEP